MSREIIVSNAHSFTVTHTLTHIPLPRCAQELLAQPVYGTRKTHIMNLNLNLVNDQLDAQFFYFIIRLLQSSTCFEQRRAHHQEVRLYKVVQI